MRPLLISTILLLFNGCFLFGGGSDTDTIPVTRAPLTRDLEILVVNNNWLDARVYIQAGTHSRSLGMVVSKEEMTATVPAAFVGRSDVRLVANLIGSRLAFRTERLIVVDGQLIVLTLEEPLDRSWITVR